MLENSTSSVNNINIDLDIDIDDSGHYQYRYRIDLKIRLSLSPAVPMKENYFIFNENLKRLNVNV